MRLPLKKLTSLTAIYGFAAVTQEWSSTLTYGIMETLLTGWATVCLAVCSYVFTLLITIPQLDSCAFSLCALHSSGCNYLGLGPGELAGCTLHSLITMTAGHDLGQLHTKLVKWSGWQMRPGAAILSSLFLCGMKWCLDVTKTVGGLAFFSFWIYALYELWIQQSRPVL